MLVRNFLESLFHERSSDRVGNDPVLLVFQSLLQRVAEGWDTRTMSHLGPCLHAPLRVDSSVIVLKFCLTAENHEEKFLIRIVGEPLPMRSDFNETSLIHEVDDGPRSPAFLLSLSAAHVRMPENIPARMSSRSCLNTGRSPDAFAE